VAGVLVLAVVILVAGCVTTGPVEPPEITLVDLDVVEVTVFETTMAAKVRIANPNPEPLEVQGASFKIILDGRKIGTGMTPDAVTLPRLGSEVVEVAVHVNNASLLLRLKEILEADSVSYGIRGALFVDGSWGTRRLKVQRQGVLELRRGPRTDVMGDR
jgi:LEA14-like dessication related protein